MRVRFEPTEHGSGGKTAIAVRAVNVSPKPVCLCCADASVSTPVGWFCVCVCLRLSVPVLHARILCLWVHTCLCPWLSASSGHKQHKNGTNGTNNQKEEEIVKRAFLKVPWKSLHSVGLLFKTINFAQMINSLHPFSKRPILPPLPLHPLRKDSENVRKHELFYANQPKKRFSWGNKFVGKFEMLLKIEKCRNDYSVVSFIDCEILCICVCVSMCE